MSGKSIQLPGVDEGVQRQLGRDFFGSDFDSLDDIPPDWWEYQAKMLEDDDAFDLAAQLRAADKSKARISEGHLMEIDYPDELVDKMLDWDAPLSEQPEVMRALKNAFEKRLSGDNLQRGQAEYGLKMLAESPDKRGAVFYHQLSGADPSKASELLRNLGIPGIKYYDAASRGKGKGTRNIVVFDPDDIREVKRDGEVVFRANPDRTSALRSGLEPGAELPVPIAESLRQTDLVEMVPIDEVARLRMHDRLTDKKPRYAVDMPTGESLQKIRDDLQAGRPLREALEVEVNPETGVAVLGDGNTRLAVLQEMGFTHIPVRISRTNSPIGLPVNITGNANADRVRPSDFGFTVRPK